MHVNRLQQKKIVHPQLGFEPDPLEPKASVLPMRYDDPLNAGMGVRELSLICMAREVSWRREASFWKFSPLCYMSCGKCFRGRIHKCSVIIYCIMHTVREELCKCLLYKDTHSIYSRTCYGLRQ